MAHQHRELHHRLEDVEKLRLYAQFAASKHHALEGLGKAKEGMERAITVENERDDVKEKAQVARLVAIAAGDAKARAEDKLARVQTQYL